MSRTLIQKHSSAIIRGLSEKISALSDLNHKLSKGELRELFVSNILKSFLTEQFSIGTGVIINQAGYQSNQTDIIIYDNRILPPFIKEQHIGVYPAESVIATIEVKSRLTNVEILKAEKAAHKLKNEIYAQKYSIYKDFGLFKPLCAIIGFYGIGSKALVDSEKGKSWLNENIKNIFAICLTNRYSWLNVGKTGWGKRDSDKTTNEETKRFIAVLLDNIRTNSLRRIKQMEQEHKDWLSVYIRDQEAIKNYFNKA
ncbi:MAG: hypothetical protein EHM34_03785 [Nitrosopumilales archaeon]|nr:MAG: hypothetical protein EHM34_03785 [Nitrosopumilales archaeon]